MNAFSPDYNKLQCSRISLYVHPQRSEILRLLLIPPSGGSTTTRQKYCRRDRRPPWRGPAHAGPDMPQPDQLF